MWSPNSVCRLVFVGIFMLAASSFAQINTLPRITAVDATNYLNQQVVVVDKVMQIAFRSNIWLLHLNQKYPKSPLNAVIRKGDTNYFTNVSSYLGQQVEITGCITNFRGRLELALTSTNQIKIVGAISQGTKTAASAAPAQVNPPLPNPPAKETASIPATGQVVSKRGVNSNSVTAWILGLLAAISILLVVGIGLFWRRQTETARLAQPPRALLVAEVAAVDSSVEAWKQRALAAEAMAGKQGQMLREQMMPELTEFAKQSLVQGLYAQRNMLLETQRKAQQALMELESRLSTIQAPLNERIRVYEKRIAELEQEVTTQGEEVRELTRATLALVRQKLAVERETQQLHSRFN